MEIWLIRHGRSYANAENRMAGHTDVDLTPDGIAELEAYVANGLYPRPQMVFSSDLRRAVKTRNILFGAHNIPYEEIKGLREIHFGSDEDKSISPGQRWDYFDKFMANTLTNGGENLYEFLLRIEVTFESLMDKVNSGGEGPIQWSIASGYGQPDPALERWAIVAHYGVLRAILVHLGLLEAKDFFRDSIPNGLGYHLTLIDGKATKFSELAREVPSAR